MKKALAMALSVVFAMVMTSCSSEKQADVKDGNMDEAQTTVANSNGGETTDVEPAINEGKETHDRTSDSNILVVYFSRTGNTEELALYAADYCGADVFEIEAKIPYTDEDIDYGNSESRTSIEQNDTSSRPEIVGTVANMDQYSMIILAYPIWWGQAPRIVDTFLESYDFSNKTIIPFCTSASSDIGTSDDHLHELVSSNVIWVEGKRFAAGTSEETITNWLADYLY
ncbi:MAG: flavodoxin [Clostridia bacterium]|nr:flavodoxin [Clostridia bacterium]